MQRMTLWMTAMALLVSSSALALPLPSDGLSPIGTSSDGTELSYRPTEVSARIGILRFPLYAFNRETNSLALYQVKMSCWERTVERQLQLVQDLTTGREEHPNTPATFETLGSEFERVAERHCR